ncbi:DNA mismatch repair endonuclease MutL [Desulfurobacterium atlanticum]|uniref:DNA mismatch repair protein MutL n=1 Tax=Desulfurobacterium atlanticum TaxID=240169 RepID=A0A238Y777_9BACT|nr:DNA mismatch repair endonuclease MutL [Desulfurobacterium atlanticum]SNR66957.1 DNA mismatch repair protein MutL [Desulfurobacterium atlanticum]
MIHRLDESIISKIAAGQIAVSPSAVLKELIENSIDANASKIVVDIVSPFEFKVVDDGEGIPLEDLPLSVERFATSKIFSIDDFNRLKTYGFRGEALHAISLFSELRIKSRYFNEDIGGEIFVRGGEIVDYKPITFSGGTAVSVSNLYFNAPIRKREISKAEKTKMKAVIMDYALANESIFFKVGDRVFYPSSLVERVKMVGITNFKVAEGRFFIGFFKTSFEGKSGKVRKIFVNRRPVIVKEISELLKKLMIDEYVLFIDVPPSSVDVNLSPLKDRVILKNIRNILDEIEKKVDTSLYKFPSFATRRLLKETEEAFYQSRLNIIGSDDTVVICEDGEYYYFFDKHLLHERVNYELLLEKLFKGEVDRVNVEIGERIEDYQKVVTLGRFGVEVVKEKNFYKVVSIPSILTVEDVYKLLNGESPESIASVACKRAIKGGTTFVSIDDVQKLINLYLSCKEKNVCPHGRPIFYRIRKREILKKLGRI